jgi:hypothetical protein
MRFVALAKATDAPIGSSITVHGIPCQTIAEQQAELCDVVICQLRTRPLLMPDNRTGPCAGCGAMLQWRPHAPRNPPKMCRECAVESSGP